MNCSQHIGGCFASWVSPAQDIKCTLLISLCTSIITCLAQEFANHPIIFSSFKHSALCPQVLQHKRDHVPYRLGAFCDIHKGQTCSAVLSLLRDSLACHHLVLEICREGTEVWRRLSEVCWKHTESAELRLELLESSLTSVEESSDPCDDLQLCCALLCGLEGQLRPGPVGV